MTSQIRRARSACHAVFDSLWVKAGVTRTFAYHFLSVLAGTPIEETHIGMFDVEKCREITAILRTVSAKRLRNERRRYMREGLWTWRLDAIRRYADYGKEQTSCHGESPRDDLVSAGPGSTERLPLSVDDDGTD